MEVNINELNLSELNMGGYGYSVLDLVIKPTLNRNEQVTDEMFSYIVNPPAMYASAHKETKSRMEKDLVKFVENKPASLKLVKLLKKEFYDFLCTESEYYEKDRSSIGGNIHVLITGISAAIATKLVSIEIGIVTSFVTCFIIVLGKMGKRTMCEYFKPTE